MGYYDFIDSLPAEKKATFKDFQDVLKDFVDILKRDQQDQSLNYCLQKILCGNINAV